MVVNGRPITVCTIILTWSTNSFVAARVRWLQVQYLACILIIIEYNVFFHKKCLLTRSLYRAVLINFHKMAISLTHSKTKILTLFYFNKSERTCSKGASLLKWFYLVWCRNLIFSMWAEIIFYNFFSFQSVKSFQSKRFIQTACLLQKIYNISREKTRW